MSTSGHARRNGERKNQMMQDAGIGIYQPITQRASRPSQILGRKVIQINGASLIPASQFGDSVTSKTTRKKTTIQQPHIVIQKDKSGIFTVTHVIWGMAICIFLIIGFKIGVPFVNDKIYDFKYGSDVRTYQVDYQIDNKGVSHFIVLNFHGNIIVEDFVDSDPTKEVVYVNPGYYDKTVPFEIEFQDINHDGKIDIIVIGIGTPLRWILINNGHGFTPSKENYVVN